MSAPLPEPWIGIGQACKLLGVSPTTLRKWVDDGRLQAERTRGGHRRVTVTSVQAHMRAQAIWEAAQAGQDLPPDAPCDILLVEPDAVAALYLRRQLERVAPGRVLRRVEDGMAAWRVIEHQAPRVVITDVGARPPDGYWLAWVLYLGNATRHIPVVVTSGFPAQEFSSRSQLPPGLTVLHKPVDPQLLAHALQTALD